MRHSVKRLQAFTLSELLIVLVIIGILVLLALPSLMPLVSRARGMEAKKALTHLHTLQKAHYYEYSRFTNDLIVLGFEQEQLVTNEENPGPANFYVEVVEASANQYIASATSVVDFDGDGEYNTWEIDQTGNLRELVKD
jgi:type IV pilus assembly protein PilE